MGYADGTVVIPPMLENELIGTCEARWQIDEATRSCLENGDLIEPNHQEAAKGLSKRDKSLIRHHKQLSIKLPAVSPFQLSSL
jgi:hypothetical protein